MLGSGHRLVSPSCTAHRFFRLRSFQDPDKDKKINCFKRSVELRQERAKHSCSGIKAAPKRKDFLCKQDISELCE